MSDLKEFANLVPESLKDRSGSVFYSGADAFNNPSKIYLLGLNPGGCPSKQASDTIRRQIDSVFTTDHKRWSAYKNEVWLGKKAGTHGL